MVDDSPELPVLEIGGTHVTAASVQPDGWSVTTWRRLRMPEHSDAESWLATVLAAAAAITPAPGQHWAVALPGPFDYQAGIARYRNVGKFDSLYGFDVGSALLAGLDGAPSGVTFVNDASAFAIGEGLIGAARNVSRFAAVTLGTGIGSAFIADGQVVEDGDEVPPHGEVHLLRPGGTPLEDLVSRRALTARYQSVSGDGSFADVREIAALAATRPDVAGVFADAFMLLGEVLGPWLAAFGAETLVVGGSIANAWDLIAKPLRAGLAATVPDISVRRAEDPERAALAGAAHAAHLPR